ncbi:MAG: helix-turn-helix domain-containing protein [Oscillospiraceae bacterium]|nr:helix-turn-helix domain-containing protein [Oscillospiraceae bacterium]
MQNDCTNIYQTARKVAGLTQERAAELLGLSPRSLADYEAGLRLPPNDVADRMVTVYNSQLLAVQHLRNSTQLARDLLPDVQTMILPEAVLTLIDAVYAFADDKLDRELIDIARDGVISENERERFDHVVERIRTIAAAAIALTAVPRG